MKQKTGRMHDGVLLIDKPAGLSSFKTVRAVSRILRVKKAGHAGTLDPMATGLLVICLGRATRISRFIMDGVKQYQGVMKLGAATDTYDAEGKITEERPLSDGLGIEDVAMAAKEFTGRLLQSPPSFSAAKHRGVPLYKLARKGQMVHKEPKEIDVKEFNVHDAGMPYIGFSITCSSGTYIRSLCHDLGQRLGCGAYLTELRRTRCGDLTLKRAITLDGLRDVVRAGGYETFILGVSEALSHIPAVGIDPEDARRLRLGQGMDCSRFLHALRSDSMAQSALSSPLVRLVTMGEAGEELVAVARPPEQARAGNRIRTEKVWV